MLRQALPPEGKEARRDFPLGVRSQAWKITCGLYGETCEPWWPPMSKLTPTQGAPLPTTATPSEDTEATALGYPRNFGVARLTKKPTEDNLK